MFFRIALLSLMVPAVSFTLARPVPAQEAGDDDGSTRATASIEIVTSSHPIQSGWEQAWMLEVSRGAGVQPVWLDEKILVASLDRNVHIVRLVPEPEVEWKKNYKGGFTARPAITADRFYLPETRRGERLVAVDRRSREIDWTADAGDMETTPLVVEDRIYTVSSLGFVKAWDRGTGAPVWETELETRIVADPVLLGSRLVLASTDGYLYAIDAGSGELLEAVHAESGPIWGDPVVREVDGGERRAIFASLEGQVIEIDATLDIVARRSFPSRFYAGPSEGADDRLYLPGHEGVVWAYDWEGSEIVWRTEVGSALRMAPVEGDGFVAIGDLAGTLHMLDAASGIATWSERLDDAITAPPLVRGERVYAITERGTLYAFDPKSESDTDRSDPQSDR